MPAGAVTREHELIAVGTTDPRSMNSVLWPAFLADRSIQASLSYRQDVNAGRVLAGIRSAAPAERPDVVFVSNPAALAAEGLLAPADGADVGAAPPHWTDADGRWVPLYVQPVVIIHNAYRGAPPRTWAELTDASWVGRACFEEPWRMLTTGPALAELSSALDADQWSALTSGLSALQPLLVADNERSVTEVATGARWIGFSNWNVATRVRTGSPVRHTFLDPTPCIPGFGALVAGAPHAGLGAAFLAWLASEGGQRAYAATGRIPALLDSGVATALERVLPPGVRPLRGSVPWVADPGPWSERLRIIFDRGEADAAEGKRQ